MQIREYSAADADKIVAWVSDETTQILWSLGRFGAYPISGDMINFKYFEQNGDCEPGCFFPFTATDGGEAVGHMIMRWTDRENKVLRFGFVVIDGTKRGKGYGKQMMTLALEHAFGILGARKVTIGVVDSNEGAHKCYLASGFKDVGVSRIAVGGNELNIIEMEISR